MDDQERILTVINYGDEGEVARVTIAPHHVQAIIAGDEDVFVNGKYVRKTNIIYMDGGNMELNISMADLATLERAIGTYFLP